MRTVLLIFGTRPEAIKMCPLVRRLKERKDFRTLVCVTGQHREMLNEALSVFSVVPDFRLDTLCEGGKLFGLYARILRSVGEVTERVNPDLVLVHGDTASAYSAALAAFLSGVPIGHIEAGLRSGDLFSPFPEEMNRVQISQLSTLDFAPTESAKEALIALGKRPERIWVTGNTVIDALSETVKQNYTHPLLHKTVGSRILFLTVHRRESLGAPARAIFCAVRRIVDAFPDVSVILPLHKNPEARKAVEETLLRMKHERILVTEPLGVVACHNLMARSTIILTDSGGVQEEAPALGKPVVVLRERTERTEGISVGGAILCGCDPERIFSEVSRLLSDSSYYASVARVRYPYGRSGASERIAEVVSEYLLEKGVCP